MDNEIRVRAGHVLGRSHIFSRKNTQDAFSLGSINYDSNKYFVGIIADGCSEGKDSEVGAKLGVKFIFSETIKLIEKGFPQDLIPEILFLQTTDFLKGLVNSFSLNYEAEISFISDYLLFTVVGFIVGPSESQVFAYGDGLVIVNQDIEFRNQNDQPDYIAYNLLRDYVHPIPNTFETISIASINLQRLAIGSDGWETEMDLITQGKIWGYQHPNGLQRKMNVWSEKEKRFQDDATLITLEIFKEE